MRRPISAWRKSVSPDQLTQRGKQTLPRLLAAIAILAVFLAVPASVANAQTPATTPAVSSVAVTSNPGTDNTYTAGDKIEITVTFSEAVTVSTTDGTPRLSIDIGDQPRNIPYERAGMNTGELIFGYTVFAGDMDADGISVQANGLALNGGTIPISQSTQKTELFLGGRFGHNQVRSGGSTGERATSTLIAGSIPHRWALLDG